MVSPKAKAVFARYLQANRLRGSQQRDLILDAFLSMPPHLTAEELHRKVAHQDGGIGLSTVYRTLRLFCDAGLAKQRHFQEGKSCFEQAVGAHHHDHLICDTCGAIVEFECQEIEDLQEQIARRHGYRLTHHRLELFGRCAGCGDGADGAGRGGRRPVAARASGKPSTRLSGKPAK